MIRHPEDLVLSSQITYHKVLAKGAKDTTNSSGTVVLHKGVPENGTWLVGGYSEDGGPGSLVSGAFGYVKPNGDLCIDIQRQSPVTKEIFYWRVYAD